MRGDVGRSIFLKMAGAMDKFDKFDKRSANETN